jgi:surfeit locus 1 family protein
LRVDARRDLPAQTCPRGPMQVRGLLARPPSSGLRMGSAMQEVGDGRWLATRIDAQSIAQAWHLALPLPAEVLRLDPALPVGFERDLDILPNTMPPDRHLGYAVQWWALALAVLITALLLTLRKTRT